MTNCVPGGWQELRLIQFATTVLTCSVMSPRGHWWCVAVLGQIISLGLGGAQLLLLLWLIATHNKSALWSLVARAAASLPQWHTPLSQELHQRHNSCWQ